MTNPTHDAQTQSSIHGLLESLANAQVTSIVWGMPDNASVPPGPFVERLANETSVDEVVGRLATLNRFAPQVKRMERELQQLQRLGQQLNRYFSEVDQELRLAGRLQRDFLPRTFP